MWFMGIHSSGVGIYPAPRIHWLKSKGDIYWDVINSLKSGVGFRHAVFRGSVEVLAL